MQQLMTQYPWLVILAAFLVGMLIMWLLEMFILRRNVKSNLNELEASLKQRDEELQTAQNTLHTSNSELKAKGDELNSALNARAAADNQIADLKAQAAKNAAELDTARQMRQQLETNLNARAAEVNDLRGKLAGAVGERDKLNATLAGAQTDLDNSRAGAAAEIAKLTAAAAASAALVKGLENSKSQLTERITILDGELSTARNDSQYLRATLDETNAAKVNIENELGVAISSIGELEAKNSALDGDIAKLTAGALAASELIKQLEGDKAALAEQHGQLQVEFEGLQKAKALDDAELAEIKLQLNDVNNALGITMRDKESYQQTLAERVNELGAAQTELASAKQDNSNLLADIAKFTARAATAAALAQGLESNKRELNAQVEQLRGELDAERQQVASLTKIAAPEPPAAAAENAPAPTDETQQLAPLASDEQPADDDSAMPYEAVCPQDLTDVRGIGPEFEQRLYNAGIGTYWELSQRNEQELADILGLGDLSTTFVNLAAIRGDALRLARETKSQKRIWQGGVPDDFDKIEGIGKTYEGRLYDAGICTYAALAQATVEQLAFICHAPHLNHAHYQSWIDQARALV